ncbi:MAG: site-2 protease family protein [Alphaproteobacteria bacterium]|nr:site-2 protease family protein [Alphaproteobacteria bacterium]
MGIAFTVSVWTLPVLLAVTFHEAAHGWVAWRLGDETAYRLGRVTFNPLRHIDSFGTVLLPGLMLMASGGTMMFGYAKPVPVNFAGLRRPRRDMVLVALAGPGSNLLLALLAAASIHLLTFLSGDVYQWVGLNLVNAVRINLLLCVFNMLPIPPLDGGRVAVGLLPGALGRRLARLERLGMVIILAGVFILPWIGGKIGLDLNVFWWFVGLPTEYLMQAVFIITGHGA